MQTNQPKVLGIVGQPGSGKDFATEYLVQKYNFVNASTSDEIREYIKEQGLGEPTREKMRPLANELRAKHGPDILVQLALKRHGNQTRIAVTGIRTTAEAQAVLNIGGSIIAVLADQKIRFKRSVIRNRTGDHSDLERFIANEKLESKGLDPAIQNVPAVIAMAGHTLDNNGTEEQLHKQIDELLAKL